MSLEDAAHAIRRYRADLETSTLEVELLDGARFTAIAPNGLLDGLSARRVAVDVATRELTLEMPDGYIVQFELGRTESAERIGDERCVVYLDQLHWITLAQQLRSPDRVPVRDREAAKALLRLARTRRVLLPFASAHLTEAPVGGKQRQDLAATVFALSRGWQVRAPLDVRQQELRAALEGTHAPARDVVTLTPGALFNSEEVESHPPEDDLPAVFRDLHGRLTSISAIYESMVDDEPMDKSDGGAAADKWADAYQEISTWVHAEDASRDETRAVAELALLSDLQVELATAAQVVGLSASEVVRWSEDEWRYALSRMPYIGRLFEMTYERLRNSEDRWERNDLVDMSYLCLAGGYADVVVGEKKASELLRRASARLEPRAFVCRTLPQAVACLADEFGVVDLDE